jgi:dimethylaniline monooxygenase (N-oxide forming)
MEYHGVAEDDVAAWEEWGGNGEAFGCAGAGEWHLKVADAEGRLEVKNRKSVHGAS